MVRDHAGVAFGFYAEEMHGRNQRDGATARRGKIILLPSLFVAVDLPASQNSRTCATDAPRRPRLDPQMAQIFADGTQATRFIICAHLRNLRIDHMGSWGASYRREWVWRWLRGGFDRVNGVFGRQTGVFQRLKGMCRWLRGMFGRQKGRGKCFIPMFFCFLRMENHLKGTFRRLRGMFFRI